MTTSNNNSRVHQERKVDFICIKMVSVSEVMYRLSILDKYSMYCFHLFAMPEKSADTQKNVASELFAQSVTVVKN